MPRKLTACTECQRRRQKCVVKRADGICTNCSKRFPPVECTRSVKPPCSASEDCDGTAPHAASSSGLPAALRPDPWNWKDWAPRLLLPVRGVAVSSAWPPSVAEVEERSENALVPRKAGSNLILDGRGDHRALRPFGGIIMEVNTLNGSPLPYTTRNTELLHFYLRFVAPNLTSIDGESQPVVFRTGVLPWQLQSPLFPNIAILMACTTQSLDRGIEIQTNPETLAMKARVLSYINAFLTRAGKANFPEIAAESMKCVINLMVMEWFWGADDSMWAHARGIKEMIRLAGGLRGLRDPVAEGILILTDYEIACCFEDELQWQAGDCVSPEEIVVPTTWTEGFDSPLIPSAVTFESNRHCLGLDTEAASVLDDVRFLTTSIVWPASPGSESDSKIRSTATWLHTRLKGMEGMALPEPGSTPDEGGLILETIRLAGLIYSWSIMSLAFSSQFPDAPTKDKLYVAMRGVSLARWKKTPGIFLWVMLVLCPGSISDKRGRFIRRKMAVAGLSIGFEDFPLGISFLRAFWLVQRWIAEHHPKEEQT